MELNWQNIFSKVIVEKVMFHIKAFPLFVNVRWKIQFVDEHVSPSPCMGQSQNWCVMVFGT
jgi:hypothetical protein